MEMLLDATQEELLRELFDQDLRDLRHEIADTDRSDFKHKHKARKQVLRPILEQIGGPLPDRATLVETTMTSTWPGHLCAMETKVGAS